MRRYRLVAIIAMFALAQALLLPSVTAHTYSSYCGNPGPQVSYPALLNIYEHDDFLGAQDYACAADSNWGDQAGAIRGFNDRMSSWHVRDRPGDAYVNCTTFWEHASYGGRYWSHTIQTWTDGSHWQDNHEGLNDFASSSKLFANFPGDICKFTEFGN